VLSAQLGEPTRHRQNVASTRKLDSECLRAGYFNKFLVIETASPRPETLLPICVQERTCTSDGTPQLIISKHYQLYTFRRLAAPVQ
jgi:hypothetical protein